MEDKANFEIGMIYAHKNNELEKLPKTFCVVLS